MKTLIHFILFYLLMFTCSAQTCFTFDEQAISSGETQHPYFLYGDGAPGFLSKWYATSGTPEIYRSGDVAGVNAFEGNQYTLLGVCDVAGDYTEGLSYSYNFLKGHSYKVSLAIMNIPIAGINATPVDVDFVLLHDTIAYNYSFGSGCSPTPAIPPASFIADSLRSFTDSAWSVLSFTISNVDSDYSQLWFRAVRSAGAPLITTFFCMDSMCINEISPPECFTFDEQAISSGETQHPYFLYGDGAPGFLSKWYTTSGTPEIYRSGDVAGVNAFEGNQYTLLGVCDVAGDYTEGLSYSYNFLKGHSYKVSLAIMNIPIAGINATPVDVDFVLLHDTIAYNYSFGSGCSPTPAIPPASFIADSLRSFTDSAWSVFSFTISNVDSNYSQLWFRAVRSAGAPLITTFFCMDSMCIQELGEPLAVKKVTQENGIVIFPNPAASSLFIKGYSMAEHDDVAIYDVLGKKRYCSLMTNSIDISSLFPGIYFVLINGDKKRFIAKFIKE